jgi:spore germination protein GerM
MNLRRALIVAGGVSLAAGLAWLLFVGLPRWYIRASNTPSASLPPEPATPGRKIKARLLYVSDEGTRLTSVERDVAFGENTAEQARHIIEAQIAPAAEPLVSAVPAGTSLRTVFVTDQGEAFVDLTHDIVTGHPGGSTSEALTVYTIVNALMANLPAVTSVQLLVDGKQVDTLVGHVDLRNPLGKNLAWVQ